MLLGLGRHGVFFLKKIVVVGEVWRSGFLCIKNFPFYEEDILEHGGDTDLDLLFFSFFLQTSMLK